MGKCTLKKDIFNFLNISILIFIQLSKNYFRWGKFGQEGQSWTPFSFLKS